MLRLLIAALLFVAMPLAASGPYTPIRVGPQREVPIDPRYSAGKAIFWGDSKVGSGGSCASCHEKGQPFRRANLLKLRGDALPWQIDRCTKAPERVNGSLLPEQSEAITYYLKKRYRL
jgi:hypothetical protein